MNIQIEIERKLRSDPVVLYMKGLPGNSSCSYSGRVVDILEYIGVTYTAVNVLESDELRRGVKKYANVRTLPLLFVKGSYIGGSDDIRRLFESDSLDVLFELQGIKLSPKSDRTPLVIRDVTRDQVLNCSKAS